MAYITLNLVKASEGVSGGALSWPQVLDGLGPADKGRLLVRGDAGMGKTTLLRWAAIATATGLTKTPMSRWAAERQAIEMKADVRAVWGTQLHAPWWRVADHRGALSRAALEAR